MKCLCWIVSVLCLGGCAAHHPEEFLTSETHQASYSVQHRYQLVCREILHRTQAEFGESSIMHELWTDTEEGLIYRVSPNLRGADFTVQVKGEGPGSCKVTIAGGLNQFQRQRVAQCVEESLSRLGAEPAGSPQNTR